MDFLWPCLCIVWVAYLWDTYLKWRQRRVYSTSVKVPLELEGLVDEETFRKSRLYQLDKSTYSLAHDLFKQVEFLIIIMLGGIPFLWSVAGDILNWFGYGSEHEISQSFVFLQLMMVYSTAIDLPWSAYSIFVVEEAHGFNKQTLGFFLKDQVKGYLLQAILLPGILCGLVAVIHWGGEYFYVYAWLFLLIVSLVMIMLYHDWIAPLFDKFTPLPDGRLKAGIEELAVSLKFPLKRILVVEGSKRSAHSNAYFYGFWNKKRIVLFDTLLEKGLLPKKEEEKKKEEEGEKEGLKEEEEEKVKEEKKEEEREEEEEEEEAQKVKKEEEKEEKEAKEEEEEEEEEAKEEEEEEEGGGGVEKEKGVEKESGGTGDEEGVAESDKKKAKGCNMDEVLAVLAHELGHWHFGHFLKNITVAQVNFFVTLFLFGTLVDNQDVYTSFGFPDSRPTLIGLIVIFQLIFTPYHELFNFLLIQIIRRFEYQADAFAKSLRRAAALRSALTKLHTDNLSFPIADPLYSAFHLSHPTYLERVRALSDKKQD